MVGKMQEGMKKNWQNKGKHLDNCSSKEKRRWLLEIGYCLRKLYDEMSMAGAIRQHGFFLK